MKKTTKPSINKILLCAGIFLLVGLVPGFSQTLGDVNNSGKVDIVDAMMIAQYCAGLSPAGFVAAAADTNCSGGIEIVDALLVARYAAGLIAAPSCGASATPTGTPVVTPTPTVTAVTKHTGNATYFYNLGGPYGGCGLNQADIDSQNFVAVNVQNTPQDYTTFYRRPFSAADQKYLGFFNNGLNCGRWVHVVIGDYCNGTNDGAMNKAFCRDGTGWTSDAYNGAELDMILADSCQDGNAWCRDDPNHLDLAEGALNKFVKDGKPVGDMSPNHWNNRQITWWFEKAPDYTGDIKIGFILSAQIWWPVIAIAHLPNGIHGVDYWDGTSWVKAKMNGDLGQSYILGPTSVNPVDSTPGSDYRIRVYDVDDQLIFNGRIYKFSFPCTGACSPTFTQITYTVE